MNSSLHLTINSCLRRLLGSCWFVFELSLGSHGVVVGSVKISKSLKQIIVSSILSLASSLFRIVSFVLFYLLGRIKESINCFRDLLPFNNTQQQLDDYALKAQQPSNNCTITPWKPWIGNKTTITVVWWCQWHGFYNFNHECASSISMQRIWLNFQFGPSGHRPPHSRPKL